MSSGMTPRRGRGLWTGPAALAAAIGASACCVVPLVLGGLGISTAAVAATFGPLRPYLIAATGALLALGFYLAYFWKVGSGDTACEVPDPRFRRLARPVLWIAAVAVTALVFFPSYARLFVDAEIPAKPTRGGFPTETVILAVSGMTCEACSVSIQRELAQVPGVLRAEVSFSSSVAAVDVDTRSRPEIEALTAAVERAGPGYSALRVSGEVQ